MYDDVPKYVQDFLEYMTGIKNRSKSTVHEYYYDLRLAFKYFYLTKKGYKDQNITEELLNSTNISNLDINFLKSIYLAVNCN